MIKFKESLHWLFQKIFALIFLVLFSYTCFLISNVDLANFESTKKWFENTKNSLLVFFVFIFIILHSNIGLMSIIDDYIHKKNIKRNIVYIKNFCFFILILVITLSLYSIVN